MRPVSPWEPSRETYQEFVVRRQAHETAEREERRQMALFRLSLTGLDFSRYAFGVEHGREALDGPWNVHAYVVCQECYKTQAGLVDPRTLVAGPGIREELDPLNEVLAVGANMLTVVLSVIEHERKHHRGARPKG